MSTYHGTVVVTCVRGGLHTSRIAPVPAICRTNCVIDLSIGFGVSESQMSILSMLLYPLLLPDDDDDDDVVQLTR